MFPYDMPSKAVRVFEIAQSFQSEIMTTSKLFKITGKGNENNVCLYLCKGQLY